MAPFFVWPILFLTLPVLVWLIDSERQGEPRRWDRQAVRRSAVDGWWFGFGYHCVGLFWIGEAFLVEADTFGWLLPLAVTGLPAGLALFMGAATALARLHWPAGAGRLLVLALALAGAEWLRGHALTGLPWNVIGYALTYPLVLMQSAGLLGIYGLTLWAVVIFSAPLVLAAQSPPGRGWHKSLASGLAIAGVPLALLVVYGARQLSGPTAPDIANVKVRLIQPSVPQRDKWRSDKQGEIFQTHIDLSRRNDAGEIDDMKGVTHVIWPEAAMPFLPLETPAALDAIGDMLPQGVHLITGALRLQRSAAKGDDALSAARAGRRRAYNSIMVFGEAGSLVALYDKIHLVPFGEYLPFQDLLEAIGLEQLTRIRGGFEVGAQPRPLLQVPGLPPVAGLVCYEAVFPAEIVQGRERPGLLVNLTNDGWFGNTTGPRQHFHQARVRAVEEGMSMIRVANNGVSAIIDPFGRVSARLDLDVRGSADGHVPAANDMTAYGRFGDLIFACNGIALILILVLTDRPRTITRG